MSVVFDVPPRSASRLNRAVDSFDSEVQRLWEGRASSPPDMQPNC